MLYALLLFFKQIFLSVNEKQIKALNLFLGKNWIIDFLMANLILNNLVISLVEIEIIKMMEGIRRYY